MIDRYAVLRLSRRHHVSTAQAEAFLEFAGGDERAAGFGLRLVAQGRTEMQALAAVTAIVGPAHRVGRLVRPWPQLLPSLASTFTLNGDQTRPPLWRVLWQRQP